MPPTDNRFRILKILHDHEGQNGYVDLRPFFMPSINAGELTRVTLSSTLYKMQKDGLIIIGGDISSLSVSYGGKFNDDPSVMAKLDYKGIDEYHKLKEQYNPEIPKTSINIGGDFTGNLNQGTQGPVTQLANNPTDSNASSSRAGLTINKWTLFWTIVCALAAIAGVWATIHFSTGSK